MKPLIIKFSTSLFLLLLSGILFISCAGYQLGNIPRADMKEVHTIYVPVVKNDSYEPGLPVMVTNAILRRIDNDGTYSSTRSNSADANLEVTVTHVVKNALRHNRSDVQVPQEYEVIIEAKATLTNLRSGKHIFQNQAVTGRTSFYVQSDAQESERQALPNAADQLAYNLVKVITEGWPASSSGSAATSASVSSRH